LHTTFLILQNVSQLLQSSQIDEFFQLSTGQDRVSQLLEQARTKHGELIDYLLPVLAELRRQDDLVRRRQFITSYDHRFFLALLLNIPSSKKILELLQARFPEVDPLDKFLDLVMELSNTRQWGSKEKNVLGLNEFDDDHLFVLECLLQQFSSQQVKQKLASDYPEDYAAKLEAKFEGIANTLRNSIPFKAMLAESNNGALHRVSKQPEMV
jgi:hypothetical protein